MSLPEATGHRILIPLAISVRAPAVGSHIYALNGQTMGTTWSVRWVATAESRHLAAAVQRTLDDVVSEMSHWEKGSALSRFNDAPAGSAHVLPIGFFNVLTFALDVARQSGGAFDPCAGALVDLWGFGAHGRFANSAFQPPGEEAVKAARAAGGWQRAQVTSESLQVMQPGGLRLDFSAIAKGYAVDRVMTMLTKEFGITDALVEIGGELRGAGIKHDGQPWWVDIEKPATDGTGWTPTRIALHGLAVATSGDYLRCFWHAGHRWAHTIDPRSGQPSRDTCSVTVVHSSCMAADAYSTAITVLGWKEGLEFARDHGIAALLVRRRSDGGFDEQLSPALEALAL